MDNNNQNQEYNPQLNQQLNYKGYNQQGYAQNDMSDTSYQQYNPQNMYYNQPNQDYNMQNYYVEQQMQVNQQIIAQQQQQIQQLMQQQYMQDNQQLNQQIPAQQYGTQNKINVSNFDISKLKTNNMYSLVAGILFLLSMFAGAVYRVIDYGDYSKSLKLFEFSDIIKSMQGDGRDVGWECAVWFAGNLGLIVILMTGVFIIYAFYKIPFEPLRIITLIICCVSVVCSILVGNKIADESHMGTGLILIVLGIIVGFISINKDKKIEYDVNHNGKIYQMDIEEEKREKELMSSGGWRCASCGKAHSKYETSCSCGMSKQTSGFINR
ncbi:MAG: hypothetical protein IJ763_08940 [Lachnospiraceae bacterium]|nr:hypothetical protein [Lachnospiraceae bacterium]